RTCGYPHRVALLPEPYKWQTKLPCASDPADPRSPHDQRTLSLGQAIVTAGRRLLRTVFVLAVRTQSAAFGLVRMVWNRSDAAEISRLHFTSKT
ncbi:MAG: hypothetical protein JWP63_2108, partial [Candidatus Solibacter sp.]|nr:hypothetical protein [Candidatus Solibacter sp.]